jgi:hypothetical protein
VDVPLPKTTSFDKSPADRAAYRDGYREGYSAAYQGNFIHRTYDRHFSALPPGLQGWQAGHYEGMAAYMRRQFPNGQSSSPAF